MNLVSPNSPASIMRIPSTGDLLIVWNNSPKKRFPLTTAISRDEGKTWKHIKNLDEDPGYGGYDYTSITFVDERVLFTYRAIGSSTVPLKIKSVPVKWLYQ